MLTTSEALANAIQYLRAGRFQDAELIYQQILAVDPRQPVAWHHLGLIAYQTGRPEMAVAHLQRAIGLKHNDADLYNDLGNAWRQFGRRDEAAAAYLRALKLQPNFAAAHNNLGIVWQELRRLDEAVASFGRALELDPGLCETHNNLGNAFYRQGKIAEAIACYRRALQLKPQLAEAYGNLGAAFAFNGRLGEAVASYRQSLQLKPDEAEVWSNLGHAFREQGKLEDAVASYRRALQLNPQEAETYSALLLTLQYFQTANLRELAAAHADYERMFAAPLRAFWVPHENLREAERLLRVGFVSPDFGVHPVGVFAIRLLENLDRSRWEAFCYSDRISPDEMTSRFRAAATRWHDTCDWSDDQLARQIRADQIDVLFDLAGHTARNRLRVFARKPAPIQVTWAGYVGTTGLAAMDYVLADRYEISVGAEEFYQEKFLRMPDGYVPFDVPTDAPPVSQLPAAKQSFVTFGSFNCPAKITNEVLEVWGKILLRVPGSRLLLIYKGMDDASVAGVVRQTLGHQGVDSSRLELLGYRPRAELIAQYSRVDVALDPFPYNGGLTTCEALWMGVPVITCPGETFASRHSLSHLSNVGLTETIARDLDEYGELAVSLANNWERLAVIRSGLRQRVLDSALCDGQRFAQNFDLVLREVWRDWCRGK